MAAREDVAASKDGSGPPEWAGLVEAYCRFDSGGLEAKPGGPLSQLNALLRFLVIEDSGAEHLVAQEGRAAIEANPENFRNYDEFSRANAGIDLLHQTTVLGPRVLGAALPERLKAMPEGPVRRIEAGDEAAAIRELIEAGRSDDAPGLSWGVLGRLVREVRFVPSWRRVDFMATKWAVPIDEFLREARPLFADHPYAAYIDSYSPRGRGDQRQQAAALGRIRLEPSGVDLGAFAMLSDLHRIGARSAFEQATKHADATYRDLVLLASAIADQRKPGVARRLLEVSPHAPYPVARLIELDWEDVAPRVPGWEREHEQHPMVLGRIARRYLTTRQWPDAERCLHA